MSLSLDDYEKAVADFTTAMHVVDDELTAVYLFGSLVRNEAIAGYSDLDFWIFLKNETLEDKISFQKILDRLTEITTDIAAAGIPVYNACCYLSDQEKSSLPAMLAPNLINPHESRFLNGDDIRPSMQPSETSQHLQEQSLFWDLRRQIYHPLFAFLGATSLPEFAPKAIWTGLHYFKYLPETICAACGHFPGTSQALPMLERLFPDENLAIFSEIRQFCIVTQTSDNNILLEKLEEVLIFIEKMASLLQKRGNANG